MNTNIKEKLREAGLTENEAKVYSTLLELGPSHAGLISRKSGLHRRVVYDTTERLIKKGMIGYILKNNIKLFQASNPNRIIEIIKEKQASISEVIPEMLQFYQQTKEKEETNFFKGKNGLKTVFEDQLEELENIKDKEREILIISPSSLAYEILPFYFKWYDKRRHEKKIKARIIFEKLEAKNKVENSKKIPLSEIRFLAQKYSSPLAINIYSDKVAIILWSKENPFAIVIKNKEVALGYRNYFELIWKIAKK